MQKYQTGYDAGRKIGSSLQRDQFEPDMQHQLRMVGTLFPSYRGADALGDVVAYDRERLARQPDASRFPELHGMIDFHRGQRDGFRDATGLDERAVAYQFSFGHFWTKRLNSRHVARWDLLNRETDQGLAAGGCTNVFIPDGADGPTIADNRDVPLERNNRYVFRDHWPTHVVETNRNEVSWMQGGVSAAVMLDEEPEQIFPCAPHQIMPDECRNDIAAIKEFMTRYADFWGPCKQIWVDRKMRAVGVEKTNRRLGFLEPDPQTGAVAVTACSYITPELAKMRDERLARVAKEKGETWDDSLDRLYMHGADKRQHRLTELTFAEARRSGGATLWGALAVVADHAVPYPQRVCLAGETCSPERQPNPEWSVIQHAAVIAGPRRRMLYRGIEDMQNPKPAYDCTPKLRLGEGVAMRPEWQADIDAGRCTLVSNEAN